MDVYLIPVGADRYELYCEHVADAPPTSDAPPAAKGRVAALLQWFNDMVARVEQEQQRDPAATAEEEERGWQARFKRRSLRWVAEKVAEQRLLWHVRRETEVALLHPDDLDDVRALAIARAMIRRDAGRHLKWTIIDGALFCASGVVALVPGPNVIAYYFGFRFVGHVLSRRGATHALDNVQWQPRSSAELTRLRRAVPQDAPERERQVREVASALHLQHLSTFFARTAVPTA
jgi:Mitochondrial K+-H+ exchange-related